MEDDQVLDAIKKLDARRLHEEPHEENTMKHPEEIYKDINGKEMTNPERLWGEGMGRRHAYDLGHEAGYAKCLADTADPLAGYSNLTDSRKNGQPIDYEKLDGKRVQLVPPDTGTLHGTLHGTLNRAKSCSPDDFYGWWDDEKTDLVYVRALCLAWGGSYGWTLYVEGEIPLRRKTADELEVGTYFQGVSPNHEIFTVYVGEMEACGQVSIHYTPTMIKSPHKASDWVVLEEYGPFQKPDVK